MVANTRRLLSKSLTVSLKLRRSDRDRPAFTLVELIVVVALIGLLLGLLLAAVQHSRESSRRLQCSNNLRQLGVAISAYHDAYRVFPHQGYTFLVAILPQMEQAPLFSKVNYSAGGAAPENMPVRTTLVPSYVCPSDESSTLCLGPGGYGSNYAGNYGTGFQKYGYNGTFSPVGFIRASDVTDGLSNTASVAEILIGNGTPDRPRVVLQVPYSLPGPNQLEQFAIACASIASLPPPPLDTFSRGRPWTLGYWTWYNHVLTPGNNTCTNKTAVQLGASTATSRHSGGVNVLLADGHVRLISTEIELVAWRALGSRNGNDVFDWPN